MSELNVPTEKIPAADPEPETPAPRRDSRPVIGGLRLRSAPGACLLFASVLLLVGIGVAVGGYWNSQPRRHSPPHVSSGRTSSEKLKLIGPVIMGVGLFIFICANTILYENRNRERQDVHPLLKAQRHRRRRLKQLSVTESSIHGHTLNLSELSIHCLDDRVGVPTLKCSSPSTGSYSSSRGNSETSSPRVVHRHMDTLALPVIRLNDCLIEEPPPLPERTYRSNVVAEKIPNMELNQVNPT